MEFGIEGDPVAPEELQMRMAKSGLDANELSGDIIRARGAESEGIVAFDPELETRDRLHRILEGTEDI